MPSGVRYGEAGVRSFRMHGDHTNTLDRTHTD